MFLLTAVKLIEPIDVSHTVKYLNPSIDISFDYYVEIQCLSISYILHWLIKAVVLPSITSVHLKTRTICRSAAST